MFLDEILGRLSFDVKLSPGPLLSGDLLSCFSFDVCLGIGVVEFNFSPKAFLDLDSFKGFLNGNLVGWVVADGTDSSWIDRVLSIVLFSFAFDRVLAPEGNSVFPSGSGLINFLADSNFILDLSANNAAADFFS